MLALFARLLSESRAKNEYRPKEELKPSPLATILARLFPKDRLRNALKSRQKAISDRLPKDIKTLNWIVCFIIATYIAWFDYSHVSSVVGNTSLLIYFILLAIISPTCFAVVWLRLAGMEWRQALFLFIWVSMAFGGIWLIFQYLGFILKYYSGYCC